MMIKDWTIYGVIVMDENGDFDGVYCPDCFRGQYQAKVVEEIKEGLIAASREVEGGAYRTQLEGWLKENELTSLAIVRSLWGRWEIEPWLNELVDKAFPTSFPLEPRICVELDWEVDCRYCEGEGCNKCDSGYTGPICDQCEVILC